MDTTIRQRGARTRVRLLMLAALAAAGAYGAGGAAAQETGSVGGGAGLRHAAGGYGARAELTFWHVDVLGDGAVTGRRSLLFVHDRSPYAEHGLRVAAAFSRAGHGGRGTAGQGHVRRAGRGAGAARLPATLRDAGALRLSAAYDRRAESWLRNASAVIAWSGAGESLHWTFTLDPASRPAEHTAYAVAVQVQRDVAPAGLRLAAGTDVSLSAGRDARSIAPRSAARTSAAAPSEDDGVAFRGFAYWSGAGFEPAAGLHLSATLRYDHVRYGYRTRLGAVEDGADLTRGRPGGALTATYAAGDAIELSAAWHRDLRAPADKLVMLDGRAGRGTALEPVRVDHGLARARGQLGGWFGYEAGVHQTVRTDDVVTLTRADGRLETLNAGRTWHRRVEAALVGAPLPALRLELAYARGRHTYVALLTRAGEDFAGNEVENAPRGIGSVRVVWRPGLLRGAAVSTEWVRVGAYWMDVDNTRRYPGHDLLDMRVRVPVTGRVTVLARAVNVLDRGARPGPLVSTPLHTAEYSPWVTRMVAVGFEVRGRGVSLISG